MIKTVQEILPLLKNTGIEALSTMQEAAIDSIEHKGDIILSAPTGTGKTIAFLGMLLRILPPKTKNTFALILTPTRELALQITQVFQKMKAGYKITTCYGGHKREIEENNLIESPSIIIGTPGRISDHIRRENIKPEHIEVLILDEFDKSLEMGFLDEMNYIVTALTKVRKKILISATPELKLPDFLQLNNVLSLEFESGEGLKLEIKKLTYSTNEEKFSTLFKALCTIGNKRTIIFVNQKDTLKELSSNLVDKGIYSVSYHGSMEQKDRETAITKFRNGTSLFLLTTDLASRGLDIAHVRFIIHYDLPENEQIFIHRNGRTARMEASGDVVVMTDGGKNLPDFIPENIDEFELLPNRPTPDKTEWGTLFISAGKKDKINKIDIAGFLMQKGGLKREDTGLIEVKDFYSFAAVRRSKMNYLLSKGKDQKIKNKKVKIASAK